MTETATGEGFTPQAALRTIEEASRYEEALRQRTEGLTNVIWGFVIPCIFLSYAMAGATFGDGAWPFWAQQLWLPWVAAGVVASVALWQTAALSAPRLSTEGSWKGGLAVVAFYLVGWYVAYAVAPDFDPSVVFTLLAGTAWTLFGVLNVWRCSRVGRLFDLGIGVAIFASGLAAAFLLPESTEPAYMRYVYGTVAGVAATSAFPIVGGLLQTFRG